MTQEKIGRYQVKSELGRGGMATVFHAYDPSFERDVAIKVLPAMYLDDPQLRTRFEREAKMIALLEHPAIVPVYDFGEQNGQPYIVMRFMAGGSLADRLKSGAISLQETAGIISRLAPSLDAAHARGIIHRDIKPGNVLFDQYGNAFLSDFGIARQGETSSATITGENIIGTPAYMSPEQVQGDKAIDGRSDIYAMGVLVYQMLTGQAPYQADTPAKVMLMHILEPVPNLLDRNLDLPAGSQDLIARAMAKDPNERYATTGDLALDLDSLARNGATALSQRQPASGLAADSGRTIVSGGKTSLAATRLASKPLPASGPAGAAPAARPAGGKSGGLGGIAIGLFGLVVVAVIVVGMLFIFRQNSQMMAMLADKTPTGPVVAAASPTVEAPAVAAATPTVEPLPTDTPAPTATDNPPTPEPTATPTPTPTLAPALPILGGADMIGFISGGNVWAANLDGSGLVQLTTDGTVKSDLQWTPDGKALTYISGKCAQIAYLENAANDIIACFNFIDSLKSFSLSPDYSQAALTIDNQMYIVPFDIAALQQVTNRGDLTEMAACKDFAPYQKNFITQVRWSKDSSTVAAKLIANLGDGHQGDIIQLFKVDECIPNPRAIDNFPPPRFAVKGYEKNPVLQNFAWDGVFLFTLTSMVRNDGFGDLYVYNTDLHKAYIEINPVDGNCCYRDPSWSPDGEYITFAYQDYLGGAASTTQLYVIPYTSIGTGAAYKPLPLPDITDPRERPQPVLRPAQ